MTAREAQVLARQIAAESAFRRLPVSLHAMVGTAIAALVRLLADAWSGLTSVFGAVIGAQAQVIGEVANAILRLVGAEIPAARPPSRPNYAERLDRITTALRDSAGKAQVLLDELEDEVQARTAAVTALEAQIDQLSA